MRPLCLLLILLISVSVHAQVDPSAAVLLGSSSEGQANSGLESGRYQKTAPAAPAEKASPEVAPRKKPKAGTDAKKDVGLTAITATPKSLSTSEAKSETSVDGSIPFAVIQPKRRGVASAPVLPDPPVAASNRAGPNLAQDSGASASSASVNANENENAAVPEDAPMTLPSWREQLKDLVMGRRSPQIAEYESQLHPDDSRLNRIEISAGTGLLSSEAKSNSAYRSYTFTSPTLFAAATFWSTPFLGVEGRFASTLNADISSATDSLGRVPVTEDWAELHLHFRKYFGLTRKATSLEYGVFYLSSSLRPPGAEVSRPRLQSSGLGLEAKMRLPVAPTYTWVFGGSLVPLMSHSESATGLNLQSGSSPESSRVGILVGGDFRLSRSNILFWDLNLNLEKNQFGGLSNTVEPGATMAATNVSVLTTQTFLHLGYRFGQ